MMHIPAGVSQVLCNTAHGYLAAADVDTKVLGKGDSLEGSAMEVILGLYLYILVRVKASALYNA